MSDDLKAWAEDIASLIGLLVIAAVLCGAALLTAPQRAVETPLGEVHAHG